MRADDRPARDLQERAGSSAFARADTSEADPSLVFPRVTSSFARSDPYVRLPPVQNGRIGPASDDVSRTTTELCRIRDALAQDPSDAERRGLIAESRNPISLMMKSVRSFSADALTSAAEILVLGGGNRAVELGFLCQAFAARLRTERATMDEAAKFLAAAVSRGFYPIPLLSQITSGVVEQKSELSTEARHTLVRALSQDIFKDHTLLKYLVRNCIWEIDALRGSDGNEAALQKERAVLGVAVEKLDLGDPELINIAVRLARDPEHKIPRYSSCDVPTRLGLLRFYSEYCVGEFPPFKRLLHYELTRIKAESFKMALAMTNEILEFKIDEQDRGAVCKNFESMCSGVDIRASIGEIDNETLITQYAGLLQGGFYSQEFHEAFEASILDRFSRPGRFSGTTQKDCAQLCEIAATISTCSPEFRAGVARRADEHLATGLDDKQSAFQLMTHMAYIAPEKWAHVATLLRQIPESVPLRLSPEAARCCYLLSRMAGLPCRDVHLLAVSSEDARSIRAKELADYLGKVWANVTRPQGTVEMLGLKVGIVDVLETPLAKIDEQRRCMALLESEHPSTTQPRRDLSQIYELLFARFAPEIKVVRVTVPTGSAEAKEAALRHALFQVMYSEELDSIESGERTVDFD